MTNRKMTTLFAGALLLPAFAGAGDMSYSYVEATVGQTEIDVGNGNQVDGDGFGIAGSLAVAPNVHLFADYTTADFDANVDANTIRVGGGYNQGITESADLIVRLAYVQSEVQTPFGDFDEDGFGVGVGVRGTLAESFELEGGIDYVDLGGDSSGDTSFSGAARYFFTPMFAVGVGIAIGDDVTTYGINARLNFK